MKYCIDVTAGILRDRRHVMAYKRRSILPFVFCFNHFYSNLLNIHNGVQRVVVCSCRLGNVKSSILLVHLCSFFPLFVFNISPFPSISNSIHIHTYIHTYIQRVVVCSCRLGNVKSSILLVHLCSFFPLFVFNISTFPSISNSIHIHTYIHTYIQRVVVCSCRLGNVKSSILLVHLCSFFPLFVFNISTFPSISNSIHTYIHTYIHEYILRSILKL